MSLKKNDCIKIKIDSLTSQASGIGRYDGIAVFVPNAAPGDELEVKIIKVSKNYVIGRIEKIIKASPDRIIVDCPKAEQCGGCSTRHISYESELEYKQKRVQDALERIGGFDIKVDGILGSENIDRYRNKAQYPVQMGKDGIIAGFYAAKSHRVVDCRDCLLQPKEFSAIVDAVIEFMEEYGVAPYDEMTHTGKVRHIYIRRAEQTQEIMVCIVVNGNGLHFENILVEKLRAVNDNISSIIINSNNQKTNVVLGKRFRTIYGKDTIEDVLCKLKFQISPRSFYQVNKSQAEKLYAIGAGFAELSGNEVLLDLYCGTGTIGLSMANKVKKLIGVEIIPEAVENAKENAKNNGIDNAEFFCADADTAFNVLKERDILPDVVVLDPPRKGCSAEVVQTVAKMSPERVVYVSCDPATLSRDLRVFAGLGYELKKAKAVDMFPRTGHVECVVLMTRKSG